MTDLKQKLINEISIKNSIVRLISAWFLFALILLFSDYDHTNLEFFQSLNTIVPIISIIGIFIVFYALSVVLFKFKIDSKILFIVTTLLITLLIINYHTMNVDEYKLLGLTIVSVIVFLYCYYDNKYLFKDRTLTLKNVLIIIGIVSFVSFLISFITLIFRYKSYISPNFDFGIFVNSFYNIKRGGAPIIGCERDVLQSHFCVHLSPILYVVFPLFFIFPFPETVQFFQAFSVMVGIIPLVLIMINKKFSNTTILIIGLLYALYPALCAVSYYDFHENCFLTFIILFLIYFMEKKKYIPFYIFLALLFSVKEDAAFYSFVLGFFMIFNRKEYAHGSITSVLSLVYFVIAVMIINKLGDGAMYNRFDNLIYDKDSGLFGAIKTIINNPGYAFEQLFKSSDNLGAKLIYLINLFLPLAFIPLIIKKPSHLLLLIPCLLNFISLYGYQVDIRFQYSFGITAFLFYLVILNINEINPEVKEKLVVISLASTFVFYLGFGFLLCFDTINYYSSFKKMWKSYDASLKLIPNDASVCAETQFCAHLANRKVLYEEFYHRNKTDTEYIVMDINTSNDIIYGKTKYDYYLDYGYVEYHKTEYILILKKS